MGRTSISAFLVSGVILSSLANPALAVKDWGITTEVGGGELDCNRPGPDRDLVAFGPAKLGGKPTFGRFKDALGKPDVVISRTQNHVDATWRGAHGAELTFLSYGSVANRNDLQLQDGYLTGRKWVTDQGLRVGNSRKQLKAAYEEEAWKQDDLREGNWWRLAGRCIRGGNEPADYPVLEAQLDERRVLRFQVNVGAAGEFSRS